MTETVIPTAFKSSLPPRKRAKTKEEKEQRRIERILRNRKAAHASREKKRKHVEFLEQYVLDVEKQHTLFKLLNNKILENHYKGGDSEIDKLISKIRSLPDLQQMKIDHNIELDETKAFDQQQLPTTPESFVSSSPKSQHEDFDVPELDSRNTSISIDDNNFNLSMISPSSSPETTNKFSLDIISCDASDIKEPLFDDVFIKTEDEDMIPVFMKKEENIMIPRFIKKEDDDIMIPELSEPYFKQEFPEQLSPFEDINTFDDSNGFEELRNSEVITFALLMSKIWFSV